MTHLTTAHITSILADAGIRPSVHRVAVMQYMAGHRTHPTADDIYRDLSGEMPSLSRTTIYNALKTLTEARLVNAITATTDGITHYDCAIHAAHSHFVCRKCSRIVDIAVEPPEPTIIGHEFKVESATTYYIGLCADCLRHENAQKITINNKPN